MGKLVCRSQISRSSYYEYCANLFGRKDFKKIFALQGVYAAWNGGLLLTFRNDLSVPSLRVKGQALDPWWWNRYNVPKHQLQCADLCVTSKKNVGLIYAAAESWNHSSLKRMNLFFWKVVYLSVPRCYAVFVNCVRKCWLTLPCFKKCNTSLVLSLRLVLGRFYWSWLQVSLKCDVLCSALGWSRQLRCVRTFTPWNDLSSEASASTATQEITCVLRDPKIH